MVGSVASRPAYPVDRSAVGDLPVERLHFGGEMSLEGGRRLAVAALLFVTAVMFTTPPLIAALVLVGVIK